MKESTLGILIAIAVFILIIILWALCIQHNYLTYDCFINSPNGQIIWAIIGIICFILLIIYFDQIYVDISQIWKSFIMTSFIILIVVSVLKAYTNYYLQYKSELVPK